MATYSRFGLGLAALFRVWFEPDFARHYVGWIGAAGPGTPQLSEAPLKQPEVKPVAVDAAAKPQKAVPPKKPTQRAPVAEVVAEAHAPGTATAEPGATLPNVDAALILLGLLQREGRLVDFLEQDVLSFSDSDVGAAARVVHAGCRKALRDHMRIVPLRPEAEGDSLVLAEGYKPNEFKLVGNVTGSGSASGRVKHPGWRALDVNLPSQVGDVDLSVVAPAEVEV